MIRSVVWSCYRYLFLGKWFAVSRIVRANSNNVRASLGFLSHQRAVTRQCKLSPNLGNVAAFSSRYIIGIKTCVFSTANHMATKCSFGEHSRCCNKTVLCVRKPNTIWIPLTFATHRTIWWDRSRQREHSANHENVASVLRLFIAYSKWAAFVRIYDCFWSLLRFLLKSMFEPYVTSILVFGR